jgi:exodeoxyribonuclease VII large subunit
VVMRRARLEDLRQGLLRSCQTRLSARRSRVDVAFARLAALGPERVLARGYALVRRESNGRLVRLAGDAPAGARLSVHLHRGRLACLVERSEPRERPGEEDDRRKTGREDTVGRDAAPADAVADATDREGRVREDTV